LRFRYRTASASNRTVRANANQHLMVWCHNLGPVDPN
jgi:hypothetical protein